MEKPQLYDRVPGRDREEERRWEDNSADHGNVHGRVRSQRHEEPAVWGILRQGEARVNEMPRETLRIALQRNPLEPHYALDAPLAPIPTTR